MNNKNIAVLTSLGLGIFILSSFNEKPINLKISQSESTVKLNVDSNKDKNLSNYKVYKKNQGDNDFNEIQYNEKDKAYTDSIKDNTSPIISVNSININKMYNSLDLNLKSKDKEDTVIYYTEATDKNGKIYKSNKEEINYSSGVKGYSYTINEKEDYEAPLEVNLSPNKTNISLSEDEISKIKEKICIFI